MWPIKEYRKPILTGQLFNVKLRKTFDRVNAEFIFQIKIDKTNLLNFERSQSSKLQSVIMDPLMSPFSMGTTTPLHHPDEELTNFHQQNQTTNVYTNMNVHNMMNPPKQQLASHAYAPSLMMPQPATPVSALHCFHRSLLNAVLNVPAKSFRSDGASICICSWPSEISPNTVTDWCKPSYV